MSSLSSTTKLTAEQLDDWSTRIRLVENTSNSREATLATRAALLKSLSKSFSEFYGASDKAKTQAARQKARNALQTKFRRAMEKSMLESFNAGVSSRGAPSALTFAQAEKLMPQFVGMVDDQARFANQFVGQLSSGQLNKRGRMGVGQRIKMYANAMTGAFNAGAVAAGKKDERIFWKLGSCDHCVDCPAIAASGPYTRHTLPTYPGQGQTECRTNCCCFLTFVPGPQISEPPEDPIDQWVKGPKKTPGFNTPTPAEVARLRDLENRKNYIRRKISQAPEGPEKMRLIAQRRDLQGQIINITNRSGIRWTPEFSVGEVINGSTFTTGTFNKVMLRGIDGTTVSRASMAAVQEQLRLSNIALMKSMQNYGLRVGPGVPTYGLEFVTK